MPTQIIAFGICSDARRVTIFRSLRLWPSCVGINSCNRTDCVGAKSSLYSYIGERQSDFAKIYISSIRRLTSNMVNSLSVE